MSLIHFLKLGGVLLLPAKQDVPSSNQGCESDNCSGIAFYQTGSWHNAKYGTEWIGQDCFFKNLCVGVKNIGPKNRKFWARPEHMNIICRLAFTSGAGGVHIRIHICQSCIG